MSTPRFLFRPLVPALAAGLLVAACDDGGTVDPGELHFGQIGEARLEFETVKELGAGRHRQVLLWDSDGTWELEETIVYDGVVGDVDVIPMSGDPELSAGLYATWIEQANTQPNLRLFQDGPDPFLDPDCVGFEARLTLTIRDDSRNEAVSWTRCVPQEDTPLSRLGTAAGPDPGASRVAQIASLMRDRTVGLSYESEFAPSFPFATIDRGDDSGVELTGPLIIRDATVWQDFWTRHSRSQGPAPQVDFVRDLVIVGAVGTRQEAGDSVEVRQIVGSTTDTKVFLQERVPGNFCAPVARTHIPFHIVRVPIVPEPISFGDTDVVRVPCG